MLTPLITPLNQASPPSSRGETTLMSVMMSRGAARNLMNINVRSLEKKPLGRPNRDIPDMTDLNDDVTGITVPDIAG